MHTTRLAELRPRYARARSRAGRRPRPREEAFYCLAHSDMTQNLM